MGAIALGLALGAQAGPAMFSASFIMHAFGNDITSGTAPPYTVSSFIGMPNGHQCQHADPYTPNGAPNDRYCFPATLQAGQPATGPLAGGPTTVNVTGTGTGANITVPQSIFGITTTGSLPTYYPYLQSFTYATFVNAAGSFFAGGGPAAGLGNKTFTNMGQRQGSWFISEGKNGFGGTMGLLGKLGARFAYKITGMAGVYVGTNSWNMVWGLGRPQFATPTQFTPMGKTYNWRNPHDNPGVYTNTLNGNQSSLAGLFTGSEWTTGALTLYANAGVYQTIFHRAGFDTVTPSGVRNIQLVTPGITHWVGPGFQSHTGHVGILTMQIQAPEPGAVLLLAAGGAVLALLYRVGRRR